MQQVKPIHVGSFELTGPEMVVTDPLYAFDAKTSVILSGCVTGKWDAYVCLSDEDIFGMRVSTLIIKAKSTEDDSCLADVLAHPYSLPKGFEAIEKGIWVDLAMAGFFDKSHYLEVSRESMDKPRDDHSLKTTSHAFLEVCDKCVANKHQAGTFAYGAVSCTGYGDGNYRCCFHRNSEGKTNIAYMRYL